LTAQAVQVTFLSPVAFVPHRGRPLVAATLRGADRAFEQFRYIRKIDSPDGRDQALVFTAQVGDREVHPCDLLHHKPQTTTATGSSASSA
jgi:hypothetical protein